MAPKRATVSDAAMGPKAPRSTVLTPDKGGDGGCVPPAHAVAAKVPGLFRDCLYALQPSIPHPTRSSVHRCSSAMPSVVCRSRATSPRSSASRPTRSAIPIDIAPFGEAQDTKVRTQEGKLHLYVGIDRTSKFAPSA